MNSLVEGVLKILRRKGPRRMTPPRESSKDACRIIAKSFNCRNPELMISTFATNITFESQNSFCVVEGTDAVTNEIRQRFAAINDGGLPVAAELGLIDLDRMTSDQIGVILTLDGHRRAFWTATVNELGKIAKIFVYTMIPHPEDARGLGEQPGFHAGAFADVQAAYRTKVRQRFRSCSGPIQIRAFILNDKMRPDAAQHLAILQKMFPMVITSITLHDLGGDQATVMVEASQFIINRYPVICVERDGIVFRDGQSDQAIDSIVADMTTLID